MPTFTCNICQDAMKGSAVDKHCVGPCSTAWVFTCVDCHVNFEGYDYKKHTQCISEAEKYHGKFANARPPPKSVERERTNKEPTSKKPRKEETSPSNLTRKEWKQLIKAAMGKEDRMSLVDLRNRIFEMNNVTVVEEQKRWSRLLLEHIPEELLDVRKKL